MYYLYHIVNKQSGKGYIGITNNLARRWRQHMDCARRARGFYFHNALGKHGKEAFTWNVLGKCQTSQEARLLERLAISAGLGHYNMTLGGEAMPTQSMRVETRRKVSATMKARYRARPCDLQIARYVLKTG
jgi:hypothetical protein